ncbi:MAG TPA: XRE family transcriptional regulator [Bryobacteraceae bacterium]|nr:XRE family transcriptional regulator [Bryobacteraceae bacterium]
MRELNPEMVTLARESRGMTQAALARAMNVQQGTISKIEAGLVNPSEEMIDRLGRALRYPKEFFYQVDRVHGFGSSVFYHRKRQSLPQSVLRKLHADMNIRRFHIMRLLRSAAIESDFTFRAYDLTEFGGSVEDVAQLVRADWKLPRGPVRNVTEAIESAGGVVVRCDFGTRKIDAISEWVSTCPPIFFVNSNTAITGDRLRFNLAHELGHIILHQGGGGPNIEDEADRFASEFLMPADEIRSSLHRLNLPKLASLKQYWKVSMQALVMRAYRLKTITEAQMRYLFIQFGQAGYRMREPAELDIPIEKPTLLKMMIDAHANELGYSAAEMSKILNLEEEEFRELYTERPLRLVRG